MDIEITYVCHNAKLTKEDKENILDLIMNRPDISYYKMAKDFGVCYSTIHRIAKKHGVIRKPFQIRQSHWDDPRSYR